MNENSSNEIRIMKYLALLLSIVFSGAVPLFAEEVDAPEVETGNPFKKDMYEID